MTDTKTDIKKETNSESISDLAKFLTGESNARKQDEELEKLKKSAKVKQTKALNRQIAEGEVTLNEDEILSDEELKALGEKQKEIIQKVKLYEWKAPIRISFPFKKRPFLMIVAVSLGFILYLAILEHYGLMFAIAALLFFIYVAGTTKPAMTTHTITSQGIDTFDKLYNWYMLNDFWFSKKNGQYMLIIDTKLRAPGHLIFIATEEQKKALFMLLQEKLLYREIKKEGWMYNLTYGDYVLIESI